MNGLTLLVLLALAIGVFVSYRFGMMRGRREALAALPLRSAVSNAATSADTASNVVEESPSAESTPLRPKAVPERTPRDVGGTGADDLEHDGRVAAEKARLVRSLLAESNALRRAAMTDEGRRLQLAAFAEDRRRLLREAAQARADTARYRELVIDLENNALPPLLDGPNSFDDLKLIVGIGPVLERMLHRLGVATYRQIARWSDRDIDEFDAKLPEFPGRIRRDGWVTQARELHLSKYGESLPVR